MVLFSLSSFIFELKAKIEKKFWNENIHNFFVTRSRDLKQKHSKGTENDPNKNMKIYIIIGPNTLTHFGFSLLLKEE